MAVDIGADARLSVSAPRPLFEVRGNMDSSTGEAPAFSVTADGRRFLSAAPTQSAIDPPVTVVLNWRP